MAENARLRQRVEELQELVDGQLPVAAAAAAAASATLNPPRGIGPRGGRRGGSMPTAAIAVTAAAAAGPGAAASDAILRGQVAQLRRQVRLQWCAVDASAAVTQEVRRLVGRVPALPI